MKQYDKGVTIMKKINLILGLMALIAAGMNVNAMDDKSIDGDNKSSQVPQHTENKRRIASQIKFDGESLLNMQNQYPTPSLQFRLSTYTVFPWRRDWILSSIASSPSIYFRDANINYSKHGASILYEDKNLRISIHLANIKEVGVAAFASNPNLEIVKIDSSYRPNILALAFANCQNLKGVEFFGVPGEIASNAFGDHGHNGTYPEYLDMQVIIHGDRDETVHQQLLNAGIREENITWVKKPTPRIYEPMPFPVKK